MIPCAPFTTRWGRAKPPRGVQVDRGHPLARGLVLAAFLNEGSGTTLGDEASLRLGASSGGMGWTAGRTGPAASFDGVNDYVLFDNRPALAPPFTVLCDIRPATLTASKAFVCHDSGANNGWRLQTRDDGGVNIVPSITYGGVADNPFLSLIITAGKWWTLAVSVTAGGTATAYLYDLASGRRRGSSESVSVGSITGTPTRYTLSSPLFGDAVHYSGAMDRALVYGRVLSAAEVDHLAAEPWAMCRPLVRRAYSYAVAGGTFGDGAGATTITFASTGDGASLWDSAASSSVTFSPAGTADALADAVATSTLTFSVAGAGSSMWDAAGATTVTFAVTGVGSALADSSGTTTLTFTVTGDYASPGDGAGTSSLSFSVAGTADALADAFATSSLTLTVLGIGASLWDAIGTSGVTFVVAGVGDDGIVHTTGYIVLRAATGVHVWQANN